MTSSLKGFRIFQLLLPTIRKIDRGRPAGVLAILINLKLTMDYEQLSLEKSFIWGH